MSAGDAIVALSNWIGRIYQQRFADLGIEYTHKDITSEETSMPPKFTVKFTGGDYKPKLLASGLVGFRAPFDIKLAPNETRAVDLKMTCSVGLLTMAGGVVSPGQDVIVTALAGAEGAEFRAGEVLARAYPLLPQDYEIE
jgi:hypothetical protein